MILLHPFLGTERIDLHKLSYKHFCLCNKGGITMSECCQGSVRCSPNELQNALSIHTKKITDSCRDKDCIEDLRVYLTKGSQACWTPQPAPRCGAQSFYTPTVM